MSILPTCLYHLKQLRHTLRQSSTIPPIHMDPNERHSKPKPYFQNFPAKVFMLLLDNSNHADAICLALTCRAFWEKLKPSTLYNFKHKATLAQTGEFLRRLERDSPNHIAYPVCLRVHKRLRFSEENKFASVSTYFQTLRPCSLPLSVASRCKHVRLQNEGMNLILKAHSLGKAYGQPLEVIEHSCKETYYGDCGGVNVETTSTAKIVTVARAANTMSAQTSHEDRLMLKTCQTMNVDFRRDLVDQVKTSKIEWCGHHSDRQETLLTHALRHALRDEERCDECMYITRRLPPYFTILTMLRHVERCSSCPTDFYIAVTRDSQAGNFGTLIVQAWRDLGPRQDHQSRDWSLHLVNTLFLPKHRKDFIRTVDYAFGQRSLEEVREQGGG